MDYVFSFSFTADTRDKHLVLHKQMGAVIHLRFHLKFVKRKAEELETILTKGYFETSWMHLTKK